VYSRIIEHFGHDPDHVCEIRVTESEIEVYLIDFDDPDWPATTARHFDLRSIGQRGLCPANRFDDDRDPRVAQLRP